MSANYHKEEHYLQYLSSSDPAGSWSGTHNLVLLGSLVMICQPLSPFLNMVFFGSLPGQ